MITKIERNAISEYYNNQEGQNYPCSNQLVCCGFVTNDIDKWNNFIEINKNNIERKLKNEIVLKDTKERWIRIPLNSSARGHRYYKIKVDKNIDYFILSMIVLPCCNKYCKEFEWI